MSHWPRKVRNRRRRQRFWTKLLLVSFVAHSSVLFTVLFLYKGDSFSYDVTISKKFLQSGAPVVFMPFYKMVNKQSVASTVQKVVETKTRINTANPRKKLTTVTAASQPEKKLIAKKKVTQKKPEPKKSKPIVAKKKKNVSEKVIAQNKKRPVQQKAAQSKPTPNQSPVYVGQKEMAALRMQEQLQKEMSKYWKPPVGLDKKLACVLKLLVDWSGNVSKTEVHRSSGILMYDISARTAVARMQMPKWARGKEFSITFKQ